MIAFDETSSFRIMEAQLFGSLWEQTIVLLDNSLRFSSTSKRTLISRSSVIVSGEWGSCVLLQFFVIGH
jgi:hypothetical protein